MGMSNEQFDAILAREMAGSNTLGSKASLSEQKYTNLMQSANEKTKNIYPEAHKAMVQSVPDGDGFIPMQGKERRLKGYDAYEVSHPEMMNDPKHIDRLERQRERYSRQFGTPIEGVTYEDVYREGEKDKIRATAAMFGDPNFEPGPINYDVTNDPMRIGDEQNPLNMPIASAETGEAGVHGRPLATAFSQDGKTNVNQNMQTPYNSIIFNGQKSRNGKSIPDFDEMENQNAQQWVKEQRALGREPTREDVQSFMQNNPVSNNTRNAVASQGILGDDYEVGSQSPGSSYFGQLADLTQSSLARTAAGWTDAAATAAGRATGNDLSNIGIYGLDKKIDHYKDVAAMDKEFGVNVGMKNKTNQDIQEAAKQFSKDPGLRTAFKLAAKGVTGAPEIILENIGESLSMIHPATLAAQIAARTNNDREEYMKNNGGKAPDSAHELGSLGGNAAAMLMEKFVIDKSFSKLTKGMQKKLKDGFKKTVAVGSIEAFKAGGGEGLQEYVDTVQQEMFTMKENGKGFMENMVEVGTSEEAITSALVGAAVGGGAHAAGKAPQVGVSAVKSVNQLNERRKFNNDMEDMDTYLDGVDKDLVGMKIDNDIETAGEEKAVTAEARKDIKAARDSKNNTLEELSKSDNKYVKGYVEEIKSSYVNKNASTLDYESMDKGSLINVVGSNIVSNKEYTEKLYPKDHAIHDMDMNDKFNQIKKDVKDKKFREKAVNALSPEHKATIYDESVSKSEKAKHEKSQSPSKINNTLDENDNRANDFINKTEKVKKKLMKTKSNKKTGPVDFKTQPTGKYPTVKEFLKFMVPGVKTSNTKAMEQIAKYDTASLKEAKNKATPDQVNLINDVLAKRKEVQKKSGIKDKVKYDSEKYDLVRADMPLAKKKTDTVRALREIASRTEMRNEEEIENTLDLIERAEAGGHINKTQAAVLKGRVKKISAKTLDRTIKEKQAAKRSEKSAKDNFKKEHESDSKTKSGDRQKYTFEDYDGNTYEGEVSFEDRAEGMVHIEYTNKDGEKEIIKFGHKRGFQIHEEGKRTQFHKGKREVVEDNKQTEEAEDTPDTYTFTAPDGSQHEGTVVAENKDDGTIDVEALGPDGKPGLFRFNEETGEQVPDASGKSWLKDGKRKTAEKKPEDPLETIQFDEEDMSSSEESAAASNKANEEILGDFDIEDLSDQELQHLSDTLNTIFDC